MKTFLKSFIILALVFCVSGCATLRPVSVHMSDSIFKYKYFYITPTGTVNSSPTSGVVVGNMVFSGDSKSVNPTDLIAGQLTKAGFIRVPELTDVIRGNTFIVNYGETGKRDVGLAGTVTEITIQFVSAATLEPICSCTGEGYGDTKADDVEQAILRCFQQLFLESTKSVDRNE